MGSWDFDTVKAEKTSAMRRYNRLRTAAKLFRFAEIGAGILFLSWTFARLPFALTISRDYFLLLSGVVSSPLFVFLLCHVIIASLVLKSRHVSSTDRNNDAVEAELYAEFVESSAGGADSKSQLQDNVVPREAEEVVYQDKQIVSEVNSADPKPETESNSDSDSEITKIIRRTKSEKFEKKPVPAKLRRSETELCRKTVRSRKECAAEDTEEEDDLSNEEFQRAIEAFIEKQLKFRHQESQAIVLKNQS
ncbi:hypothetical protein ACFX13_027693 [Malus domestica]|uniref:uncharacterized protein LOC126591200 n=1 Tax=Malus sylvestris TaxID=3752 RepID=UPI0021AC4F7F|nr:uncharacterized protein LOC126591200 [Malus sylvestris]